MNLIEPLQEKGRSVIKASIDGFHRPRTERYRRGTNSPEGYYLDSFDNAILRSALLLPLGPGGNRVYHRKVFDFQEDLPVERLPENALDDAILLFDGVFLLRPELSDCWDLRIFVAADFAETLKRAQQRDRTLFGSVEGVLQRYQERYIPGQKIYLAAVRPQDIADIVVDNNDPINPGLLMVMK